jgi:ubiquinone/menaquinone biosynthesis C-methylase UbiE
VTDGYVHGYADEEQARLISQAEHWRDEVIVACTNLPPGTRLLEVGCGVGAVLGILGDAFPGVLLSGVDIEERQIEAARAHLAHLGIQADLRLADALELPFQDASFDHVWMMWFLEHLSDPVAALREARRVLVPGGRLTAIEVDYTSTWASPSSDAFEALFAAIADAMGASGHNDAGAQLAGWLVEAGFEEVDPGQRRLNYSGDRLARQVHYVADVVESTLPRLAGTSAAAPAQLEAGLAHLRALPSTPGSALGWHLYKASAMNGRLKRTVAAS